MWLIIFEFVKVILWMFLEENHGIRQTKLIIDVKLICAFLLYNLLDNKNDVLGVTCK